MFTRSAFAALAFTLVAGTASGEGPNLGKPITEAEIAPWDISNMPDGTGLPSPNSQRSGSSPGQCAATCSASMPIRPGAA